MFVSSALVAHVFKQEAFSFFSHLIGAILGLAGLIGLVLRADSPLSTAAFVVYGATLVVMFTSSTLHHVSRNDDGLMRKLDHTAIYLFIAGTYTPVCLLVIPPAWGFPILGFVWAFAVTGIFLRFMVPRTPRWVLTGLYLALGWVAVIGIVPLVEAFPRDAIFLLAGGGIVYSVGAVIYATKRPDPWPARIGFHGLWHVFVLVGAALHFALIWHFVAA